MAVMASQPLDIGFLLDLARDRSDAGRERLLQAIERLLHVGLGDRERDLAGDILIRLCREVEMEIRRALADQLAGEPDAPKELIRFLARDEIPVATPVLQLSPLLEAEDLVAIVRQASADHARIVATRPALPEPVSVALAQTGDSAAVRALLENAGTVIPHEAMVEIAGLAESRALLRQPLVRRPELSGELATRLYVWVGRELRGYLAERFDINRLALDRAIEGTLDRFVRETEHTRTVSPDLMDWAQGLSSCGRINAKLMLRVLRQGRTMVFLALYAAYFGLSIPVAKELLAEKRATRMAIASRAAGISKEEFASLFLLSRDFSKEKSVIDPRDLSAVLKMYDRIDATAARAALGKLQAGARIDPMRE